MINMINYLNCELKSNFWVRIVAKVGFSGYVTRFLEPIGFFCLHRFYPEVDPNAYEQEKML